MPKITFIGAGSTVFAKRLMADILSFPELSNATITLYDIDEERLQTSLLVASNIAEKLNINPTINATIDRREALESADYAICMIQVAGYKPGTVIDFEIPKKYGLRQTIADTIGIGGIMRALRTIPVLLDICHDMEELCPKATFLNYVNPMAMNTWAINRASGINSIGLCHSVFNTAREISRDINVPLEEINYTCAGINHMAFYLTMERKTDEGVEDLYPRIWKVIEEERVPAWNRVRYNIFKRLGYFVTESSEHFSEYVPWFIKHGRSDLIDKFNIPLDEYITRCEMQNALWEIVREKIEAPGESVDEIVKEIMGIIQAAFGEIKIPGIEHFLREIFDIRPSGEYAPLVIHSLETGIPRVIYGNVINNGLIDNLPFECAVEVPCLVDKNGIQPIQVGKLPIHLAALIQTNINVQALTVEAALTQKREHIYHAAMLDPHTAAELDIEQICNLVDDLIAAHGDWLPEYH